MKETKPAVRINKTKGEEHLNGRSKFKMVEMSVFSDNNPDSWLFRADQYF